MSHHVFRDGLVSPAPLHCGTEDGPTDDLRCDFSCFLADGHRRWGLVQPVQKNLLEFLLQSDLEERHKLPIGWLEVILPEGQKIEHGENKQAQGAHLQGGCGGKLTFQRMMKLLAHPDLQEGIFVFKVSIKGGSVDRCSFCTVLY